MSSSASSANKDVATKLTVIMLWLLLGVFVLYPLCRLFATTFWVDGSFTLDNLRPFMDNWYDRRSAVNSILLGCSVGAAGTVLGFIFAFVTTRLNLPTWLNFAISAITILPLISPPFTSSYWDWITSISMASGEPLFPKHLPSSPWRL